MNGQAVIAVAGATGGLGGRIVRALASRGAGVRALVRPGKGKELEALQLPGVQVVEVDLQRGPKIEAALAGAQCVVAALQGLREVIVDTQARLVDAAVAAKVLRFIPSDFSSDFTKIAPGDNRNFDLRRELHEHLDQAKILGTSILNGAFAEVLAYGTPFLDTKATRVGYWESPDWRVDFTTMDDTAAFTAAAALDPAPPRVLRIAGFQLSAKEMAALAGELTKTPYELVRMGTRDELAAHNRRERAAHPEGEREVFPRWQQSQYMHSMFTAQLMPLDNDRYAGIEWTGAREVLAAQLAARS